MDKRWLSQLLNDSAFPLIVLAVAVSQVKIGHQEKSNGFQRETPPFAFQLDDRSQGNTEEDGSRSLTESPRVGKRPLSNKKWVH